MKASIPKLRRALQPPLSRPGATADSDRAKSPPLTDAVNTEELKPGDRVEELGDFGRATGEIGTVVRANEDDAEVKWDGNSRTRRRQLALRKV